MWERSSANGRPLFVSGKGVARGVRTSRTGGGLPGMTTSQGFPPGTAASTIAM